MEPMEMNKEQVIEETIKVLANISVPVALKRQILEPIEGAINNLAVVLQMIKAEKDAAKAHEDGDKPSFDVEEITEEEFNNERDADAE